jgi:hypothetical protein
VAAWLLLDPRILTPQQTSHANTTLTGLPIAPYPDETVFATFSSSTGNLIHPKIFAIQHL